MILDTIKKDKAQEFTESLESMFESEELTNLTGEDRDEYLEAVSAMKKNAVTYAQMRENWEFMTREERINKDDLRTSYHNEFMTSVKLLIRLANMYSDNRWSQLLRETEEMPRKDFGDIACYITYLIAVSNR
ncbi:MAG: hypothetical protein J5367_07105 [Lachnospiraceae bacterium]|nr:hypothetical protein [Lachnospiraceae bacterium]